jgi:hypothetical protein
MMHSWPAGFDISLFCYFAFSLEFAYLANIYTNNSPPYILQATLSKLDWPFVEVTIQILGKNNLD